MGEGREGEAGWKGDSGERRDEEEKANKGNEREAVVKREIKGRRRTKENQ